MSEASSAASRRSASLKFSSGSASWSLRSRMKYWLSVGVQLSASASEVNSEAPTVMASARKKTPVTPVVAISGTNTTIGVMVENTSGLGDLAQRAADGFQPALSGVAMQGDILDHDDGIVDHQADGGSQSAERHQVEALVQQLQDDERDKHRGRNDQHATSDVPQSRRNSTMMSDASTMPMRMASRTLLIDSVTISRLIVERRQLDARRQRLLDARDLVMNSVRNVHGVAVRLSADVQQNRRLAVRGHDGVDRLHPGADGGHIDDADRHSRRGGFHDDLPDLIRVDDLPIHQAKIELVILLEQSWRIDEVGASNRVENVG